MNALRKFSQKYTNNSFAFSKTNGLRSCINFSKFYNNGGVKFYRQVKDLNQIMYTTTLEEEGRTEKFLEYTTRIHKPSKTITFDRNGEVLLFSCDSWRHVIYHFKEILE